MKEGAGWRSVGAGIRGLAWRILTLHGTPASAAAPTLPLAGMRGVEFTQRVMRPRRGMVLGDPAAEVIKIAP